MYNQDAFLVLLMLFIVVFVVISMAWMLLEFVYKW
jgi:hypothetical protein